MGVSGLWKKLSSAAETRSYTELAVTDGYNRGFEGGNTLDVGIDISLWLRQACAVFRHNHHSAGPNPELRVIFYRLARLLQMTTSVVLVYDGPERPKFKRGKSVRSSPHWLTAKVRHLASLFGFRNHDAPGEAEAELALLNQLGCIRWIVSDDVDTFLFGGLRVIRNPNIKNVGDKVQVYKAKDIVEHTNLNRGELILVGLVRGGDYDTHGVRNCGIEAACGLARYGLGTRLIDAFDSMSPGEFNKFLVNWREQLRVTLRSDPAGYLGRKYNGAARHITAQFPDRTVLRAYAQPSTSWSQVAGRKTIMRMARGESCQPNVTGLADFCVRFFEWSPELLCEKFAKIVWPGACLKMLCQPAPRKGVPNFRPGSVTKIVRRVTKIEGERSIRLYRATVNGDTLVQQTQRGIESAMLDSNPVTRDLTNCDPLSSTSFDMWIPLPVVRQALPLFLKGEDIVEPLPMPRSPSPIESRMEVDIDVFDLTLDENEVSESAPLSDLDPGEKVDLTGASDSEYDDGSGRKSKVFK